MAPNGHDRVMKLDANLQSKALPKNKALTFGDFVAGVYRTWGERKAKGIIRLALEVHMVEFRGTKRFVIS
jgi:hypothetical protein